MIGSVFSRLSRFSSISRLSRRSSRSRTRLVSFLLVPTLLAAYLTAVPVPRSFAVASQGKLNVFDAATDATSASRGARAASPVESETAHTGAPSGTRPYTAAVRPATSFAMRPGALALRPGVASRFTGNDGRLEVDVPAGAVTASDLSAHGGSLGLRVTQIGDASGASAGGSGRVFFGTYLVQVVNTRGQRVALSLRQPLTLRLHLGSSAGAVDLGHTTVLVNGAMPSDADVAPLAATARPRAAAAVATPRATSQLATVDTGTGAVSATMPLVGSELTAAFTTSAPVSTFGTVNPFSADLSSGSLTAGYPVTLPNGPSGLTPPLSLRYDSAAVSEQHNKQAAAGWAGEGWDVSMGEITWKEDKTAQYWSDSWQLTDPYGLSDALIPPTVTTSTYYEDRNGSSVSSNPVQWHTATESHAKIYSYKGPLSLKNMSATPPCFRVYLPNGIMEEYGCTSDSLQYYPSNGKFFIAAWKLDLITDPHGNQIHLTYQSDMATVTSGGDKMTYPRDTELATIEWDSPTCQGAAAAQKACSASGSAPNLWAPLDQVSFKAGHAPERTTGSSPSGCDKDSNTRCDDPSVGTGQPYIQQTFVLNQFEVDVRASAGAAWNMLSKYKFSYEQSGPSSMLDPWTNDTISVAGKLNLTKFVQIGDDDTTTLPARTFTYSTITEAYTDYDLAANPAPPAGSSPTNCGPDGNWWNSQPIGDCALWDMSYGGNSYYLATATNGMGLAQTFTWAIGRPNVDGIKKIDGNLDYADPTFCNGHMGDECDARTENQEWTRAILTQQASAVVRAASSGNQTVTSTTSYSYKLTSPVPAQKNCTSSGRCFRATMYWRALFHYDVGDYHDDTFMGFAEVEVTNPDGSVEYHKFHTTLGMGTYDSKIPCDGDLCHTSPWWDPGNALHGLEYENDVYDTDGSLLRQVKTQYALTCPPAGVSGSPKWKDDNDTDSGFPYTFTWDGQLVSALDNVDPIAVCDIQTSQVDTYTRDGAPSSSTEPHVTTTYTYDTYGRVTGSTTTGDDGSATGSPVTSSTTTSYVWNDTLTATSAGVTGTYLIDLPATADTISADGARHYQCSQTSYDGLSFATGQDSSLTYGDSTSIRTDTSCGTSSNSFTPSGDSTATYAYDAYGSLISSDDPNANAGDASHRGCTLAAGGVTHTVCGGLDATTETLPVTATNAAGQAVATGYGAATSPAAGFGLWQTSATDANGQATTTAYDPLGRITATASPGETGGLTTTSDTYTSWCSGSNAQTPCLEVDKTQRVDATHTTVLRTFYDGFGRAVETRAAATGGQDVVTYIDYDPSGRPVFASSPYYVPAYTGAPGSAAFAVPDASRPGTTTTYTSLRASTTKDALSNASTTAAAMTCGVPGTSDTACYVVTTSTDALGHESATYADALGRTVYSMTLTGGGSSATPYSTTAYTYDEAGDTTKVVYPGGAGTATYTYDDSGDQLTATTPDRGAVTYSYDADGNVIEQADARGAAGTTYAGYDALDRIIWRNTTNSSAGAYATYSYDDTANGNNGVGRLTGETFSGPLGSGSYHYTYDARGELTDSLLTVNGVGYDQQATYNDAGQTVTHTYPDGEVVTNLRDSTGTLTGETDQQAGATTTLLSNAAYTGPAGASGTMTGASVGGGTYQYSATYDSLLRLTDSKLTRTSDQAAMFEQARGYDANGNVTSLTTTLPQGTDNQAFCYDDQSRLTWAGSTGTAPCTGGAVVAGTLTSGGYQQSFAYDTLDRPTTGPSGTDTYGDTAHLDAVTNTSGGYSAAYDAAGDLTCRAATAADGSCSGPKPSGATLAYDNEGRLTAWQSAANAPASSASDLYDVSGNRVEQQTTVNGVTTTTVYIGGVEEVTSGGGATTTTTYYYDGNEQRFALAVDGVFSYLATDGLGSATVALDASGGTEAAVLYSPYGSPRYTSGTMPTDYGFTGQHTDGVTGLNDDSARFYDPVSGQFASADSVSDGLNGYAYVHDNPETLTDPTGHAAGDWSPEDLRPAAEEAEPMVMRVIDWVNDTVGNTTTILALITLLATGIHGGTPPPTGPPGGGTGGTSISSPANPSAPSGTDANNWLNGPSNNEDASNNTKTPGQGKPTNDQLTPWWKKKGFKNPKATQGAKTKNAGKNPGKGYWGKGAYVSPCVAPAPPPAVVTPPVTTVAVTTTPTVSIASNPVQAINTASPVVTSTAPAWQPPSVTLSWTPPAPVVTPPVPMVTPTPTVAPAAAPNPGLQIGIQPWESPVWSSSAWAYNADPSAIGLGMAAFGLTGLLVLGVILAPWELVGLGFGALIGWGAGIAVAGYDVFAGMFGFPAISF